MNNVSSDIVTFVLISWFDLIMHILCVESLCSRPCHYYTVFFCAFAHNEYKFELSEKRGWVMSGVGDRGDGGRGGGGGGGGGGGSPHIQTKTRPFCTAPSISIY